MLMQQQKKPVKNRENYETEMWRGSSLTVNRELVTAFKRGWLKHVYTYIYI